MIQNVLKKRMFFEKRSFFLERLKSEKNTMQSVAGDAGSLGVGPPGRGAGRAGPPPAAGTRCCMG